MHIPALADIDSALYPQPKGFFITVFHHPVSPSVRVTTVLATAALRAQNDTVVPFCTLQTSLPRPHSSFLPQPSVAWFSRLAGNLCACWTLAALYGEAQHAWMNLRGQCELTVPVTGAECIW